MSLNVKTVCRWFYEDALNDLPFQMSFFLLLNLMQNSFGRREEEGFQKYFFNAEKYNVNLDFKIVNNFLIIYVLKIKTK